ncbi:hypothetical protein [Novosphingobium album (ex Liu et al. 2023)]|uniref:hypothetical protein n=1 Tax=Novosphingobium album (ex Liu et al. 2023) TaxID=3031130 RepID=UPI0023AEA604|nr:hypothetical protein [Novosphingobium album (ex Liu et al. 2023)]
MSSIVWATASQDETWTQIQVESKEYYFLLAAIFLVSPAEKPGRRSPIRGLLPASLVLPECQLRRDEVNRGRRPAPIIIHAGTFRDETYPMHETETAVMDRPKVGLDELPAATLAARITVGARPDPGTTARRHRCRQTTRRLSRTETRPLRCKDR